MKLVRDTDRSLSPPFRNATTSFRYCSGWMNSGCASMCASSGSAYADSRKKYEVSLSTHATGFSCVVHSHSPAAAPALSWLSV